MFDWPKTTCFSKKAKEILEKFKTKLLPLYNCNTIFSICFFAGLLKIARKKATSYTRPKNIWRPWLNTALPLNYVLKTRPFMATVLPVTWCCPSITRYFFFHFLKKKLFQVIILEENQRNLKFAINKSFILQALDDAKTAVRIDSNFVKGFVRISKCCIALGDTTSAKQVIFKK